MKPGPHNDLSDIHGLRVGSAQDADVATGVTVVLCEEPAIAAVDVRGGAPGTRETDLLRPDALVERVDAVVLAGGSVYGLEAASAACAWLGARGRGYRAWPKDLAGGPPPAPIVPAAILFDLTNGGNKDWGATPPYARLGREACAAAWDGGQERCVLGTAGAGYGAAAGTLQGGLGAASAVLADGTTVAALVAVNAIGSPVMPGCDALWPWPFEQAGEFGGRRPQENVSVVDLPAESRLQSRVRTGTAPLEPGENTVIAVVATDASLTKPQCARLAVAAQDGIALAVQPAHTVFDGDTVFTLATGRERAANVDPAGLARIGWAGAVTLARAMARAVYLAEGLNGRPAYRDRLRD